MPEISRFFGIIIKMFYEDHLPPHFHAEYGEFHIKVSIPTLSVIEGKFPPKALGLVVEWASQHQPELSEMWERARKREPLFKIAPLE
jgi:hypothetical protein